MLKSDGDELRAKKGEKYTMMETGNPAEIHVQFMSLYNKKNKNITQLPTLIHSLTQEWKEETHKSNGVFFHFIRIEKLFL